MNSTPFDPSRTGGDSVTQPSRPRIRASRTDDRPQAGSTVRLSRLRRIIASRMVQSLQSSAQLTAVQEADLSAVTAIRDRVKDEFRRVEGVGLTHLAFFARATLDALREYPQLNASVDASTDQVTYHPSVHLGIAVDTPGGLLVPVVRDADDLTVPELAIHIARLAERARTHQATPDELTGSTFTLTNIGSAGSLLDTPIINQPEVAILGTGAIQRMARVLRAASGEETIAVRPVCYLPLTYDHRLIDGATAGRFLSDVVGKLERADWEHQLEGYDTVQH